MKPETSSLMRKAVESLAAAQLLLREGYADFAASRGYYGMFYAAEAVLLEAGQSYSSHSAVIAAFGRDFAKPGRLDARLHRLLIDAQDFRNLCDYSVGPRISVRQSQELLATAEEFVREIERHLTGTAT